MAWYGWFGLGWIVWLKVVRLGAAYGIVPAGLDVWVGRWFTPLVWWGYVLFADAWVSARTNRSWLRHHRIEFVFMVVTSNLCWLVFEGYNLLLRNWEYHGLSPHWWEDWAGRFIAYATIFPGVFLSASLFAVLFRVSPSDRAVPTSRTWRRISLAVGILFLVYPLLFPNPYLFAPVWLGFIFLLDPINEQLGGRSLAAELKAGNYARTVLITAGGYLCGFLWEYWNTWADARWVYHLPYPTWFRIFEMPVLGFLGFGPFALECYVMYEFLRRLPRATGWRRQLSPELVFAPAGGN